MRITLERATSKASWFFGKWYASTSKAAWIASTTFIVLIVPLVISMEREQVVVESENQQMNVLTGDKK
jgi:hypothetical protein